MTLNTSTGIVVSRGNTTTSSLGGGASFTGVGEPLEQFEEVTITCAGSPADAPGDLYFEFSPDNTHWDLSVQVGGQTLAGPNITPQIQRIVLPFFRIRYVNGSTPQTEFRLTTVYHRSSAMRLTRYPNQTFDDAEPIENVRAVISYKGNAGAYLHVSSSTPLPVSFPSGVSVTVSGSTGLQVAAPSIAPVWVTGSVALNPTPVITANTATTGSAGLAVGNAPYAPLFVTGSVALNPTPVITANTATTGTTGLAVGNAPYQPLFVSVTSSLPVTFGGLPPLSVFNATNVGVTGSVQAWNQGTVGVSGTVGVNNFPTVQAVSGVVSIGNWPVTIGVSSSFPLRVFDTGVTAVSGTVQTWTSGLQGVSGTVSINNFPLVQAVSGSQLTGSTFAGSPVVVGGVFSGSTAATVKAIQTDASGAVYVTTSGSIPVAIVGTVPISFTSQVSVNNFPATQNVTGGVVVQNWPTVIGVSASVPFQVWSAGTVGVSGTVGINNFPSVQAVSGVVSLGNWPTTMGVSSSFPLRVWDTGNTGVTGSVMAWSAGTQSVSGTVQVWTSVPQGVSGSQLTGSTFSGFPVVVGGVSGSVVKALLLDVSGAVYVTATGSIAVSTTGSAGLQVSFGNLSQPVSMSNSGPTWVTGSVALNPTPVITANTATTGSTGLAVGNAPYQPLYVSITSSLPVSFPAGVNVTVSGSTGLMVAAPITAPVWVTGSVALNPTPVITANTATTGSAGLAVGNAPYQPLFVSITSSLPVTFPAGVNVTVSGSTGLMIAAPAIAPVWVTGSVALNPTPVITANTATTGSTGLAVGNAPYQPLYVSVTSSLPVTIVSSPPLSVWNAGTVGVSGSVSLTGAPFQVWTAQTTGVSGTVGVNNFPAVQAVSGSQLTGSTFAGSPIVVGGVFYTSGILGSGSYVKSIETDISGAVYVTTSGSLPVSTTGSAGLQVSFGGISQPITATGSIAVATTGSAGLQVSFGGLSQPVSMSNSGPIGVFLTGSIPVTITGSAGLQVSYGGITQPVSVTNTQLSVTTTGSALFVGNSQTSPIFISVTSSLPVTFGGLPPLSVFNAGPVGVSGTVGINNFPAVQAVSGSQLTGSTFVGSPVVIGGVFYTSGILGSGSYVKTIETDISGAVYITTSGSLPVSTTGSAGLQVSFGGISQPITATGSIAVSTTGSAGLQVSFGGTSQPVSMSNSGPIGVFLTGSIPVTITGSAGLQVSFGGASQPVTALGTVKTWDGGIQAISGTVGVNNFPAVQAVSGSQLTGSTFVGSPVVIGGVFYTSGILGSGSYVKSIETDISGAVYVTTSGSIPVSTTGSAGLQVSFGSLPQPVSMSNSGPIGVFLTGSIPVTITGSAGLQVSFGGVSQPVSFPGGVNVTVTGSTGLMVGAPQVSPVWVTGSVGLNPVPTITANTATTGAFGLAVGNAPYQPLFISVTSSLPVTFAGLPPLSVWNASPVGVTGTVGINNFPAIQAVSGSQLTGSTFIGSPVVVGGVFYTSGILGSGSYVKSIETDISGAVYVTTSGSIPVSTTGSAGLQVSFGSLAQPVSMSNSGPIGVFLTGSIPVTITGSAGLQVSHGGITQPVNVTNTQLSITTTGTALFVGNSPTSPVFISVTSSLPVTFGGLPPLSVWNAGLVGVSGTVGVNNFPAVQAVSGSQLTGSTFAGSPVVVGGVFYTSGILGSGSYIKSIETDISGAVYITTSGSIPVSTTGSTGLHVSFGGISQPITATGSIAVSTTGSAGLQVSFGSLSQPVSMSNTGPIGVFLTGSIPVTITGSAGLQVSHGGITQPVNVTNTQLSVTTTGTALFVGNSSTSPLFISVTSSLPVTFGGLPPLSVWNASLVGVSGTVGVNNFPSVQAVSGSQLTGSTFAGSPVVVGGVFYTSGILGSGSYVKSIETDISGAVYVTTSGSIPVSTTGSAGLQVSFGNVSQPVTVQNSQLSINNFPATQNVSGTVTANVTVTGSTGLLVAAPAISPLFVTGTVSVFGTAASGSTASGAPVLVAGADATKIVRGLLTDTGGAVYITTSGTIPVSFAAAASQNVAGASLTGSTLSYNPVVIGGVFYTSGILGSGSYVKSIETDISGAVYVTASGSLAVSTTGSLGLQVSFGNQSQPVSMSNSGPIGVFLTGSIPVTITGSAGLQVSFGGISQPITATGSIAVSTTGSAGLQVSFGSLSQPVSMSNTGPIGVFLTGSIPVTITGSAGLQVSFGGTSQPVNVTSQISVNNFPSTQNVSGTVKTYDTGIQAVSGSQLTGSTFTGSPIVIGGVFYTSGILGSGSYVKSIETDISGAVYITTSGSIPVSTTGSTGLHVSFGGLAQPVSMSNSGPIGVFLTGSIPVTITGSAGLQVSFGGISQPVTLAAGVNVTVSGATGLMVAAPSIAPVWVTGSVGLNPTPTITANTATTGTTGLAVGNAPYTPLFISVTSSLPVTFAGLPPLSVWNASPVGVSGTVQVWTSGLQGISGTVNVTTTGSTGLAIGNSAAQPLFISVTSSLPVTFAGLPPLSVWNAGTVGVSGTVNITATGSIAVSTTGSAGLQVSHGGIAQPVTVTVTGSTGLLIAKTDTFFFGTIITGSTSATSASSQCFVSASTVGLASVGVFISSSLATTWVNANDSISFEGTINGTDWFLIPAIPSPTGSAVTSTTTNGVWTIDSAGFFAIRARGQLATGQNWVTNGTASIWLEGNTVADGVVLVAPQLGLSFPITATGSIAVSTTGSFGLQISHGGISQPVSMSNSGPIGVFLTGSIPVSTTGSAGLQVSFGTLAQPVSMSNTGPIGIFTTGSAGLLVGLGQSAWNLSGSIPVAPATINAAVKGTQGTSAFTTQDFKDAGRVIKMFCTSSVSGVLGEALFNMQAFSGFSFSGSVTSSFLPTNGKTLRLQAATLMIMNNAIGVTGSIIIRMRVSGSATDVTAKSPSVWTMAVNIPGISPVGNIGLGQVGSMTTNFPDGFELTNNNRFGFTQQATNTSLVFDFNVVGFEY